MKACIPYLIVNRRVESKRRTRPVTYDERRHVNGENKSWKGAGTNNDVHSADGIVKGSPSGDMVYQGSLEPNYTKFRTGPLFDK